MRERAESIGAAFMLVSTPGRGTVIDIVIGARQAYARAPGASLLARLRRRLPFARAT